MEANLFEINNEKLLLTLNKIESFTQLIDMIIIHENGQVEKIIESTINEIRDLNSKCELIEDTSPNCNYTQKSFKKKNYINSIFESLFINDELLNEDENIFEIKLSNFYLNLFLEANYRFKTFQNLIEKQRSNNIVQILFSQIRRYKQKGDMIIRETLQKKAIDNYFEVKLKFLKEYTEIFELESLIIYSRFTPQESLLSKMINDEINKLSYEMLHGLGYIISLIDFLHKFIVDKSSKNNSESIKLGLDMNILSTINYRKLFRICRTDKSLNLYTNKLLKIYPEECEEIIKYLITKNNTSQACKILKQNILKNYVCQNTINELIWKSKCKALNYHYSKYYNYEIDIEQLIELFSDESDLMTYMANKFAKDNLLAECYFVLKMFNFDFKRINLEKNLMQKLKNFLTHNCEKKNKKLRSDKISNEEFLKKYVNDRYINIQTNDYFGPVTENCIQLDINLQTYFIDKIEDFSLMTSLSNNFLVGIDCEWRPQNTGLEEESEVAIMQISTKEQIFIFDLLKLNSQTEFSDLFSKMFENKTFIGFSFKNDIKNLKGAIKNFFTSIDSFIELNDIYNNKFNVGCPSLLEVCRQILKKDLCKKEQISNWERRPLRLRQLHYAALDAYILLKIYESLI